MTNQWILWAILHPILRETPHWQKMKTWWHGSCRIAIPCHTGMYIHVYSVLLCLCHYVQYETGDSTKNNRVYSCVRIENCTPLGAKTSHEQLIGDVIEHLAALWTRMFWFVAETYRNHVHQTHKTMAKLWPWQCYATYATIFLFEQASYAGRPHQTNIYPSHVWRVGFPVLGTVWEPEKDTMMR